MYIEIDIGGENGHLNLRLFYISKFNIELLFTRFCSLTDSCFGKLVTEKAKC